MHLFTSKTHPPSDARMYTHAQAHTHTHTHTHVSTEYPKGIIKNINTIINLKKRDSNSDTGSNSCFTAKNKSYH